ncbi:hypothetical protein HW115_04925 [Verrucomicrobiaceae bacterium N1E253]|uniref:Protein kinase domain-containing protein n=1 Tax=Oceaniferula marina TaxID=2748318 RepID=A0A851GJR7_9BACT|nr:hypothetical protein [Oceaniferula marina]NWK54940.1 hypothetical protein [Oceaniferula marina]
MVTPDIDGVEILGLIGKGACGSVFVARRLEGSAAAGEYCAVRVLNPVAVNVSLVEKMLERAEGDQCPEGMGAVEIKQLDGSSGSVVLVMPLLADVTVAAGKETTLDVSPRNLDIRMSGPELGTWEDRWDLIERIARSLASMHQHHVPHGNIKPSNIFFDDAGEVVLTDCTMGYMPGVGVPPYTNALLYAPPEQLTDPSGYTSGKGYGWDVYAFGMLAFRLLTGCLPDCDSTRKKRGKGKESMTPVQNDLDRLMQDVETMPLDRWLTRSSEALEVERRNLIARCLEIDPNKRFSDLNDLLHVWHDLAIESDVIDARQELHDVKESQRKVSLAGVALAVLASAALIAAAVLAYQWNQAKTNWARSEQHAADRISAQEKQHQEKLSVQNEKLREIEKRMARAIEDQELAERREQKHKDQLISLGVANDHLLAWMMRDHSKELPELQKSGSARDILIQELQQFLKLTEDGEHFQEVRARIMMQLAELRVHKRKPVEADVLLDQAVAAWQAAGIEEPGHAYRVARARAACLIQALDQNQNDLAKRLLPKARVAAMTNQNDQSVEAKRLNAVLHVIDGRMLESTDPAKALQHFEQAIKGMQGVHRTLTEHVTVRSDLARFQLEAAKLAGSMNQVEDATRLRGDAAKSLETLLQKNPHLKMPKIQLAKIHIMAATAEIQEGQDVQGARKLDQAEALLKSLPAGDHTPDGANMQRAAAMGLRAVLLRDAGKASEAKRTLNAAIALVDEVVRQENQRESPSNEPLYRLAVLNWQLAGIMGDGGNRQAELKQGKQAAELMESLLKGGAGTHDTGMRRALGYLYGDLGHTAALIGNRSLARDYYQQAAKTWQSLIEKNGKQDEYLDGLKWSESRSREMEK